MNNLKTKNRRDICKNGFRRKSFKLSIDSQKFSQIFNLGTLQTNKVRRKFSIFFSSLIIFYVKIIKYKLKKYDKLLKVEISRFKILFF